jgi:hypothetical protein
MAAKQLPFMLLLADPHDCVTVHRATTFIILSTDLFSICYLDNNWTVYEPVTMFHHHLMSIK